MYFAPYIDESGIHFPTYTDIRDALLEDAKTIFGQDIYLENDSQDYQFISSISQYIFDTLQIAQHVYNSRGPSTAIGTALDVIVKQNGIKRKAATYSTCNVVISGTEGTIINNGVVQDINGNSWDIPPVVTIGAGGTITVLATAQNVGPIYAAIGFINSIVTPTYGWDSVTNNVDAIPGNDVESDSIIRSRQSISTAQASQTLLGGLLGGLLGLPAVTRAKLYENDTNAVDSNSLPPHSISAIVEGSTDQEIADKIFIYKAPGCATYGTTSVNVIDAAGLTNVIKFYRPTYIDIDVVINVKALGGYTSSITDIIKSTEAAYLSSLEVGADLSISSLWAVAMQATPDLKNPLFSILGVTAAKHGQSQSTDDIVVGFNQVTRGDILNITVNVS